MYYTIRNFHDSIVYAFHFNLILLYNNSALWFSKHFHIHCLIGFTEQPCLVSCAGLVMHIFQRGETEAERGEQICLGWQKAVMDPGWKHMCSFHCSVPALESQTHRLLSGGTSFPRDACCHVKRYHHHSSTPASVISNSLSPTEGGKVMELTGKFRSSGWLPWA